MLVKEVIVEKGMVVDKKVVFVWDVNEKYVGKKKLWSMWEVKVI